MNAARSFLAFSVLIWLPYGLFCFVQPGFLNQAAGIAFDSPTASTELRAMYGGLQAAIGSLALTALLRPRLVATTLIALAFLCSGLALGRIGGVILDGGFSQYTGVGLAFEIGSAALAIFLLTRLPGHASA